MLQCKQNDKQRRMNLNKKWLLSITLIALIALLAACGNDEEGSTEDNSKDKSSEQEEASSEQPKMPEPDLEGVPEVVAKVNGKEITKEEFTSTYKSQFQQVAMRSQMTGQELDQKQLKKQVADSLVGQQLLIQEANDRGLEVSEKEVNQKLEELAKQNKLESKEKFLAALKNKQGMSEEEVRALIKEQIKIDKLLAKESGDLQPTEEEVQKAYDDYKAQQEKSGSEGEIPSFDEVKPSIEQQLVLQEEAKAYQNLVEKLRKDADVTVNL